MTATCFYAILYDCNDTFCTQPDATTIVEAYGLRMPKISIGFDGTPLLSFSSIASSVGDGTAVWFHGARVHGDTVSGSAVSHTTTVDGRPIIFYDNGPVLYSATCGDFDCTIFDPPVAVTTSGSTWPFRGLSGYPVLIHADATGVSLIECGSPSCVAS